jgi:hypothetical protein
MKKNLLAYTILLLFSVTGFSQVEAELDGVKVYTLEGWKIKAKNSRDEIRIYTFSFVTEGRNKSGEVVYSVKETYGPATLQPNEERDLFTTPQDPNKEITYTFNAIKLIIVEGPANAVRRSKML